VISACKTITRESSNKTACNVYGELRVRVLFAAKRAVPQRFSARRDASICVSMSDAQFNEYTTSDMYFVCTKCAKVDDDFDFTQCLT